MSNNQLSTRPLSGAAALAALALLSGPAIARQGSMTDINSPMSPLNINNPLNPSSLQNPSNPLNPSSPLNPNNPASPLYGETLKPHGDPGAHDIEITLPNFRSSPSSLVLFYGVPAAIVGLLMFNHFKKNRDNLQ